MNARKFCLVAALLVSSWAQAASPSHTKAAEALLDSMNMQLLLEQSITQMLEVELQQNPAMQPYREVMLTFLNKHMSYKAVKDDMVRIYTDAFSEQELKEISAFYASSTGRKALEKTPELMQKGAMLGASRVQQNMQELQSMIEAEAKRLQTQ